MSHQKAIVTAVIVTYESRGTICRALDALSEAYIAGLANTIVVDNASHDGTADIIALSYSWVTLIRSEKNIGYGRGCNLAFKKVQTPYVLLLNPDAEMDVNAIDLLVDFMNSHRKAGISAPSIIEGENRIQAAGLMTTPLSILKGAFGAHSTMPQARPVTPGNLPFQTTWVCGAVMLIRSELYKRLGGFDPRFFLYFEETDLCLRTIQQGMEIWAVGEAVARHVGGASARTTGKSLASSCIAEHYYPSRFYYLVKHYGWIKAIGTETMVFILQQIRNWKHRFLGRPQTAKSLIGTYAPFRFPEEPSEDTK